MVLSNLINSHLAQSLTYYRFEASYLTSFPVTIKIEDDSMCSSALYYGNRIISLGSKFYPTVRRTKDDKDIPLSDVPVIHNDIALLYEGVYFHELGHLLYTAVEITNDMISIFRKQNATKFFEMYAFIANVVEDVAVEGEMKLLRPHIAPSIDLLRRVCFSEVKEDIKEDLNGATSVLLQNYRALTGIKVRFPNESVHKAIMSWMYVCVNTSESDVRAYRSLAFARMLWDVFNLKKEPHLNDYKDGLDSSFYNHIPEEYKDDKSTEDTPDYNNNMEGIEKKQSTSTDQQAQNLKGNALPSDGDVSEEAQSVIPHRPQPDAIDELPNKPLDKNIFQESFDAQTFTESRGHTVVDITKLNHQKHAAKYPGVLQEYNTLINRVASIIKKQRSWNTTRWEPDKTSGVLNEKSFMKRTHKIYKQRTGKKHEADLLISILLDNSGSMGGQRTNICGKAVIVLAEVCHKLKIPFEIKAFTSRDHPITLIFKNFNQSYEKVKESLMWIVESDSHPDVDGMFCGNVDEVNLEGLWRNMRTRTEEDKIIIVVSDGQTCGSRANLKRVIQKIEKDKISVLGLGIQSSCVADIYKDHKLFESSEDLEELPSFLTTYLKGKVFK